MTTITIKYFNADDSEALLGEEISIGISEKQLPYDPREQNIFIRKVFARQKYNSWKVLSIDLEQDTEEKTIRCKMLLSPVKYGSQSVSEKHSSNGSKLIRGRLLECDFGYFSQEVSLSSNKVTTTKDYNSKLPFEMVKRRLVVVVSNKEDPALVVPISTSNKSKNHNTVVPISSLPNDLVTFKTNACYAKAGAVCSVSGHRLFPLRVEVGSKRVYDFRIEKKLSNDDVVNIKKAIFLGVGGHNILSEAEEAKTDIGKLQSENELLHKKLEEKSNEISELWKTLESETNPA